MNKGQMETMFSNAGFRAIERARHGDYDIYIADGFSRPPHHALQAKFGFKEDDYEFGCYVTFWLLYKGGELQCDGGFVVCEPDQVNARLRAKAAIKHAVGFIETRKRIAASGQTRHH